MTQSAINICLCASDIIRSCQFIYLYSPLHLGYVTNISCKSTCIYSKLRITENSQLWCESYFFSLSIKLMLTVKSRYGITQRKKPYFNSKEPSLIKSCCQSNCLISSRHKGEDPVGINISDRQMNAIITDPTCYRFLDLLQWHRDMRFCHVGSWEVHCHLLVKWSLLDMLMGSRLLALCQTRRIHN